MVKNNKEENDKAEMNVKIERFCGYFQILVLSLLWVKKSANEYVCVY